MDVTSAELAKFSVEAYADQLDELYAQTRQEFLAELALRGTALTDLIVRDINDEANAHFLRGFVNTLPHADRHYVRDERCQFVFDVNDENIARALQANVLWLRPRSVLGYDESYPGYILGESRPDKPRQLLLAPAVGESHIRYSDGDLTVFRPRILERRKAAARPILKNPAYTDDEMHSMFDRTSRNLRVGPSAQGSREFRWQVGWQKVLQKLESTPVPVASRPRPLRERVSDEAFQEFNILDQLNELARLFGTKDQLLGLIDEHFLQPQERTLLP